MYFESEYSLNLLGIKSTSNSGDISICRLPVANEPSRMQRIALMERRSFFRPWRIFNLIISFQFLCHPTILLPFSFWTLREQRKRKRVVATDIKDDFNCELVSTCPAELKFRVLCLDFSIRLHSLKHYDLTFMLRKVVGRLSHQRSGAGSLRWNIFRKNSRGRRTPPSAEKVTAREAQNQT